MKVKLKDFECKYHTIELLIDNGSWWDIKGIYKLEKIKKKYGDYYVYSYKYFEDIKTTSVIITKEPEFDCEEDTTPHFTFK